MTRDDQSTLLGELLQLLSDQGYFNAPDRHEADRLLTQLVSKDHSSAPDLATWMETNVPV